MFSFKEFSHYGTTEEVFRIECNNLSDEEIEALAIIMDVKFSSFGIKIASIHGISSIGERLAKAFEKYLDKDAPLVLIVDDVLMTGKSMTSYRSLMQEKIGKPVIGCVIFDISRGKGPEWVHSIFRM